MHFTLSLKEHGVGVALSALLMWKAKWRDGGGRGAAYFESRSLGYEEPVISALSLGCIATFLSLWCIVLLYLLL